MAFHIGRFEDATRLHMQPPYRTGEGRSRPPDVYIVPAMHDVKKTCFTFGTGISISIRGVVVAIPSYTVFSVNSIATFEQPMKLAVAAGGPAAFVRRPSVGLGPGHSGGW